MCLYPRPVRVGDTVQMVKCGRCLECMKERQNDIAHRLILASKLDSNIHFFTLTYSNEKVPLYLRASEPYLERIGCFKSHVVPFHHELTIDETLEMRLVYDYQNEPDYYFKDEYRDTDVDCDGVNFNLLGEYIDDVKFDSNWSSRQRRKYWNRNGSQCYPQFVSSVTVNDVDIDGEFSLTPSLRNSDVSRWVRSFRKGGRHKTFKFKYYYCGEYGPRTDRPHYHMITYGLTDSQAEEMRRRWIQMYGDAEHDYGTTVSRVKAVDFNQEHISKAARYVGKYITKGIFESDNVTNKFVVRPRSVSSGGMYIITKQMFDWYTGRDILDLACLEYRKSLDFKFLPSFEKDFIIDNGLHRFLPREYYTDDILRQIKNRHYYTLPGDSEHKYSIGRSIKNKCFKYVVKDENVKSKKHVFSSPLSSALSDFVRRCAVSDVFREFGELRQESPELSLDKASLTFAEYHVLAQKERGKNLAKNYTDQLRKSVF